MCPQCKVEEERIAAERSAEADQLEAERAARLAAEEAEREAQELAVRQTEARQAEERLRDAKRQRARGVYLLSERHNQGRQSVARLIKASPRAVQEAFSDYNGADWPEEPEGGMGEALGLAKRAHEEVGALEERLRFLDPSRS